MSELEVYEPQEAPQIGGVLTVRDPVAMLEQAAELANHLKSVVERAGLISKISGKDYLTVEAWTTLGVLVGCTARTEWTRPIDGGWEAAVEVVNAHGMIVGRAEASCLRSERNWQKRDDYAIRSMAQTRAMGKALRMPLGWIAALAGYEATPAEEMPPQTDPKPDVETDGKLAEKPARSIAEWDKKMNDLEVPQPMDWLRAGCDSVGITERKWANVNQRANRVMLHLCDHPPASSLGFWSIPEIQAAFAAGFDGNVIEAPEGPPPGGVPKGGGQ